MNAYEPSIISLVVNTCEACGPVLDTFREHNRARLLSEGVVSGIRPAASAVPRYGVTVAPMC